jgi:type I restriction enzyme S subunit
LHKDVLVSITADIGSVAVVRKSLGEAYINQHIALLRPIPEQADCRWLAYALCSHAGREQLTQSMYGGTKQGLGLEDVKEVWLSAPSLPEQHAIADFLDRKTQAIDALIQRKERLIALLQEKRQALITQAVTKGLDPTVPMKDSGIEWLGEIPAHWEVLGLRRFIQKIDQGWSPVAEDRLVDTEEEWGVLKLSAVSNGIYRMSEHKTLLPGTDPDRRFEVHNGDLLITRSNTPELVGDVCVVERTQPRLILCDLIYRLTIDQRRVLKKFLAYFLLSPIGRIQIVADARGTSQSMVKVSQSHIKSWFLAVPPKIDEQQRIIETLDEETMQLRVLEIKVEKHIRLLREYRQALISAAVTGKINVTKETA